MLVMKAYAHTERGVALVMKAVLSLINACWEMIEKCMLVMKAYAPLMLIPREV